MTDIQDREASDDAAARPSTGAAARRARARRSLCLLLAWGVAAGSQAAGAAQWVPVARTDDATQYLDAAHISRLEEGEGFLEVHTRLVFGRALQSGANSSTARVIVNCERHTQRTLSTAWFDTAGRLVERRNEPMTPEQAVEAMRAENVEYSARLAPLCAAIATQAARGRVIEPQPAQSAPSPPTTVRMRAVEGPTNRLFVRINDSQNADMILDPGAAMTALPKDLVERLRRSGALKDSDIVARRSLPADKGKRETRTVVRLKSVEIEGQAIDDVEALLLERDGSGVIGQSLLKRLRSWKVDAAKGTFTFVPNPSGPSP